MTPTRVWRGTAAAGAAALLASLIWLAAVAKPLPGCTQRTMEVGIVKATGCWVQNGANSPTWRAGAPSVNLNGFTLATTDKAPLWLNTETGRVTSSGEKIPIS